MCIYLSLSLSLSLFLSIYISIYICIHIYICVSANTRRIALRTYHCQGGLGNRLEEASQEAPAHGLVKPVSVSLSAFSSRGQIRKIPKPERSFHSGAGLPADR